MSEIVVKQDNRNKAGLDSTERATLIEALISSDILSFGEFTLKSGLKSPYFFNLGNCASGKVIELLASYYAKAIIDTPLPGSSLFGPAYKGIPLVSATAACLFRQYRRDMVFAFNRKEQKDHGEGGIIVGRLSQQTILLDDVLTRGTAITEAKNLIEAHHGKVSAVITAFDRQEPTTSGLTAIEQLAQQWQLPVLSLLSLQDVIGYFAQLNDPRGERLKSYIESV